MSQVGPSMLLTSASEIFCFGIGKITKLVSITYITVNSLWFKTANNFIGNTDSLLFDSRVKLLRTHFIKSDQQKKFFKLAMRTY